MESVTLRACLPTQADNGVSYRLRVGLQALHREYRRLSFRPQLPVSILIANYNTREMIEQTVRKVQAHTRSEHELIIVDNGSTDGSAEYLRNAPGVRALTLTRNIGHGKALDLATLFARGETLIALDSDAYPVADTWVPRLTSLLEEHACAGVHHHREYVHPCCLAIRARTFFKYRLSFQSRWSRDYKQLGKSAWDVGEGISLELRRRGHSLGFIPLDPGAAEIHEVGEVGTVTRGGVYGGIVYHAWYGSRLKSDPNAVERDLEATRKAVAA